ncbi:MAG: metallopeptidase family protein [Sphingomonadales bacterium]|nr:metallopeptidase family protein [Alphaproteobacteria bacterium]MDE2562407.1 metallopeptidase family protein [Sphingomonadales bacterium]MDE2568421.1 metallopeptidase family protein [Sphingomonadales bacterium]
MSHYAPTAHEIEHIARAAMRRLPPEFQRTLGDIVLTVEEFADRDTLDGLGIDSPWGLIGVYQGIPLTERSIMHSGTMPDRIRLFRQPLLADWHSRPGETLERVVAHVLIHEVGHHFGLSDSDMYGLEDEAD